MPLIYIIDLDERGRFLSHVEDTETGEVIAEYNEETLAELVEDGYVKHFRDTANILEYVNNTSFWGD